MRHIPYHFILLAALMGLAREAWAEDIHITTIAELNAVADNVLGGHSYAGEVICLDNDLVFDGTENNFTPIGSVSDNLHPFAGTFDGQGHTISGINLSGPSRSAPFALVTGSVRNLTVSNSSFSSTNSSSAGVVAALNGGTVQNCHVTPTVHVRKGNSMGGIAARCEGGNIIGCTSAAAMGEDNTASNTPIGGILAHSVSGDVSVQKCLYFGHSMNTLPSKGAIVGVISSGAVSTTALSQNFYCTPQSGIKGIGHYERAISPAGGNLDIDLTDHHGAVCAHVVTADADISDMGSAGTPLTPGGITPYDNGIKFNDVHYSHILALENNGNYSGDALADFNGRIFDVILRGRRFYRDGDWNTFCLPFSVSTEGTIFGEEGREIRILDTQRGYYIDGQVDVAHYRQTGYREEDHHLYLFFKTTDQLDAGTPYIVKWTKPDGYNPHDPSHDYCDPVFRNVTIDNACNPSESKDGAITFVPAYAPVIRDNQDRTLLLVGAGSTLYYPQGNGTSTINSFRAYFQLNDGLQMAADGGSGDDEGYAPDGGGDVKAFVVDLDHADLIREVKKDSALSRQSIHDLSGRRVAIQERGARLTTLPSGVYIANGKKILIR